MITETKISPDDKRNYSKANKSPNREPHNHHFIISNTDHTFCIRTGYIIYSGSQPFSPRGPFLVLTSLTHITSKSISISFFISKFYLESTRPSSDSLKTFHLESTRPISHFLGPVVGPRAYIENLWILIHSFFFSCGKQAYDSFVSHKC